MPKQKINELYDELIMKSTKYDTKIIEEIKKK
jgi:hypothetical protein